MSGSPLFADDPSEPHSDAPDSSVPESDEPAAEGSESRQERPLSVPPHPAVPAVDERRAQSNGTIAAPGSRARRGRLLDALAGVSERQPPPPRPTVQPGPPATSGEAAAAQPGERPAMRDPLARLDASDAYRIRNGRYEPDTWWTRLKGQLATWSKSSRERELDAVDAALKRLRTRGVRTGQLIAVGSAKGGTGKDSIAITLGDVIASTLRAPTLVLDADWDFGTLGERAPEEGRSPGTVLDVHAARDALVSPAQLGQFVARMPSGCHLLSAPRDPDEMERLEVEHYVEVVDALRRFYSVILVTMAPGVLAPICKWAFGAADQIVFVTDTRRVTADQTLRALPLLRKRHPEVPLNLVINQVPAQPNEPQRHVIDAQLGTGYADRDLLVPYDLRLEQQLDSGTLDLEDPDLPGPTRIALKQATLAVAERLG